MDGRQRQVVVDDDRSLVYLAQQACITPHTWLCRADDLDRPGPAGLRPRPERRTASPAVRRATRLVGELLDDLGLSRTSRRPAPGATTCSSRSGARPGFDEVRASRAAAARCWSTASPDLLTLEARKAKRGDRVLRRRAAQRLRPDRGAAVRRPRPAGCAGLDADHLGRAVAGRARAAHRAHRGSTARPRRRPLGSPPARSVPGPGARAADPDGLVPPLCGCDTPPVEAWPERARGVAEVLAKDGPLSPRVGDLRLCQGVQRPSYLQGIRTTASPHGAGVDEGRSGSPSATHTFSGGNDDP